MIPTYGYNAFLGRMLAFAGRSKIIDELSLRKLRTFGRWGDRKKKSR